MLLCAAVAPVVADIDSCIDLKVSYTKDGVEVELTNKASSPIVVWAVWFQLTAGLCSGQRANRPDRASETRHFTAKPPRNCRGARVQRVSAIFADGTWTGEWSDFERPVKLLTIRRLVLQRWLISLRALEKADDPLALLGRLMDELNNVQLTYRISTFGTTPSEEQLRKAIEIRAQSTLRTYVKRYYDNVLLPVYRSNRDPKGGRDKRAEKQLRSRADAKQRIAEGIAREIEIVSNELDDLPG